MALLASLSPRGAYLVRELSSDRVEPAADPANSVRGQPSRRLEIGGGEVVAAHVDVRRQLRIGAGAVLELAERLDSIRSGLRIRAACGQRALQVIERGRALVVRAGVDGLEPKLPRVLPVEPQATIDDVLQVCFEAPPLGSPGDATARRIMGRRR